MYSIYMTIHSGNVTLNSIQKQKMPTHWGSLDSKSVCVHSSSVILHFVDIDVRMHVKIQIFKLTVSVHVIMLMLFV